MAIDKTYNFRLQIANPEQFKREMAELLTPVRSVLHGSGGSQGYTGSGGYGFGDMIAAMSSRDNKILQTLQRVVTVSRDSVKDAAQTSFMGGEDVRTAFEERVDKIGERYLKLTTASEEEGIKTLRSIARAAGIRSSDLGLKGTAWSVNTAVDIEQLVEKKLKNERIADNFFNRIQEGVTRKVDPGYATLGDRAMEVGRRGIGTIKGLEGFTSMVSVRFLLNSVDKLGVAFQDLGKTTGNLNASLAGARISSTANVLSSGALGAYIGSAAGPIGTAIGALLGGGVTAATTYLGTKSQGYQLTESESARERETLESLTQLNKGRVEMTMVLARARLTNEDEIHAADTALAAHKEVTRARKALVTAIAQETRAAELFIREEQALGRRRMAGSEEDLAEKMHQYALTNVINRRSGNLGNEDIDSIGAELSGLNEQRLVVGLDVLENERRIKGMTEQEYQERYQQLVIQRDRTSRQLKQMVDDDKFANDLYRSVEAINTQSIRARASEKLHLDYELRKLQGMPEDLNKARQEAETWKFLRDQGQALIAGQHRGPLSTSDLWNQAVAPTNELTFDHMAKAIDNLLPKLISGVDTGNKIAQSLMDEIRRIMNPRKPEQRDQWVVGRLHEEYDIKSPFKPNYWSFLHYTSLHDDEAFEDRAWALKEKSDDIINRRKLIDETMRHNPFQAKADVAEALAKHGVFNRLEPGTVDELMGRDAGKAFTGVIDTVKDIIDKVARVNEALADIRATKELDTYINNAANGYYGSLSDRARNKLLESDDAKWWGAVIKKLDDMVNELRGNNAIHTAPTTFGD